MCDIKSTAKLHSFLVLISLLVPTRYLMGVTESNSSDPDFVTIFLVDHF